jgi:HK97 family phage major capsid protein
MKSRTLFAAALALVAGLASLAFAGDFSTGHQAAGFALQFDPSMLALAAAAGAVELDPAEVRAALSRIEAQARLHREQMTGEITARLQNVEQHIAGADFRGGAGEIRGSQRVSASVLAEAGEDLENLRNGRRKSIRMSVQSLHPMAAAITSGDLEIPAQRDSEVYGPMRRATSIRDLLVTRRTTAPSIEYLRATRTGDAALQAAEGDAKAELAMGFDLIQAAVKTIACWVPASRQALDDATMLADYIDMELRDALRLKEDQQLLKGTGTGANIEGLWTVASAFNRGTGTLGAVGASDTPPDTLRRAITQLQLARGTPTGIVLNPVGLELLELEKDLEDRYLLSLDVRDQNGRTVVWRVPVVVTDAIDEDEWMVGDFVRAARLYDRMQATVEVATEHADYFVRNLVAILAEERVALTIPRPDLLIIGTFNPVSS